MSPFKAPKGSVYVKVSLTLSQNEINNSLFKKVHAFFGTPCIYRGDITLKTAFHVQTPFPRSFSAVQKRPPSLYMSPFKAPKGSVYVKVSLTLSQNEINNSLFKKVHAFFGTPCIYRGDITLKTAFHVQTPYPRSFSAVQKRPPFPAPNFSKFALM